MFYSTYYISSFLRLIFLLLRKGFKVEHIVCLQHKHTTLSVTCGCFSTMLFLDRVVCVRVYVFVCVRVCVCECMCSCSYRGETSYRRRFSQDGLALRRFFSNKAMDAKHSMMAFLLKPYSYRLVNVCFVRRGTVDVFISSGPMLSPSERSLFHPLYERHGRI